MGFGKLRVYGSKILGCGVCGFRCLDSSGFQVVDKLKVYCLKRRCCGVHAGFGFRVLRVIHVNSTICPFPALHTIPLTNLMVLFSLE